ncbi:478_t:CDS:2 [Funneliformis geosporum]|nr:478_t:CDS:2 [Funneliformis geosporum]
MSYSPGTIVYAKLKGYPWWPARVEVESSLPSQVRSKKPKTPKPTIGVRFFGTKDYGWFGSNDLKPFDKKDAEITLQKMKKRDKLLERSILRNQVNLTIMKTTKENFQKRSKIRNKGNKKIKKATTPKGSDHRRTKSLGGGKAKKKSHTYTSEEDDDVINDVKGGKKRRASEGATIKRKQRKIDYTDDEKMDLDEDKSEDETKKKERRQNAKKDRTSRSEGSKSSDNESPEDDRNERIKSDIIDDDESKSSRLESEIHHRPSKSRQSRTPGDRLLHLRHKLQRMTLKDDVESLDMDKIDEVFTEVENFKITIPLLKESKIGKLMRKIAEKDFDPDPKRIIERSNELIRKWKCLLETPTQEGSDEETSPKTVNQVESPPNLDEVVDNEKSDLLLSYEQAIDIKKDEDDVDNSIVKVEKENFPTAMDVDDSNNGQPKTGEEKLVVEDKDNIVTNGSSSTTNNQEVNSHEKEDNKSTTLEL